MIAGEEKSGHDNDGDCGGDRKGAPDIVAVVWLVDWVESLLAGNFLGFLVKGSLNKVHLGSVCLSSYPSFRVGLGFTTVVIPSTKCSLQTLSLPQDFPLFIVSCHSFQKFYPCFSFFKVSFDTRKHKQSKWLFTCTVNT